MRIGPLVFFVKENWLFLLKDTGGEWPLTGERSDATSVGARLIAPWGRVGKSLEQPLYNTGSLSNEFIG